MIQQNEAVNSSYRKVIKKGSFPNVDAVYKALYLKTQKLSKKWEGGKVSNWANVLNQLLMEEKSASRIEQYLK